MQIKAQFLTSLLAIGMVVQSCQQAEEASVENNPETEILSTNNEIEKIDALNQRYYQIIGSNLIGISQRNSTSSYLAVGNPYAESYNTRRSVYNIKDSTVITDYAAGTTEGMMELIDHNYQHMTKSERDELSLAIALYNGDTGKKESVVKPGIPILNRQEDTSKVNKPANKKTLKKTPLRKKKKSYMDVLIQQNKLLTEQNGLLKKALKLDTLSQ